MGSQIMKIYATMLDEFVFYGQCTEEPCSVSHVIAFERECWLRSEMCVFGGSLDIELFSEKIFIREMAISF